MTNKSKILCCIPACNQIAVNGAYCAKHGPAPASKETDAFYLSVRWRRFRAWYSGQKNTRYTGWCEREGRLTLLIWVDHVIEIKDGGNLTSEENAMSLCWKCHAVKTAKKQKIIGNPTKITAWLAQKRLNYGKTRHSVSSVESHQKKTASRAKTLPWNKKKAFTGRPCGCLL